MCGCTSSIKDESEASGLNAEEHALSIVDIKDSVSCAIYANQFEFKGIRYISFRERNKSNIEFFVDQSYYMTGDTVDFCGRTWVALTPVPIDLKIRSKIPTIE